MDHAHHNGNNGESWLFSRTGIATIVAVSILGFLVYQGHGAHLLGVVPYLLILACPLMHIFMHGRHNNKNSDDEGDKSNKNNHKHGGGCH